MKKVFIPRNANYFTWYSSVNDVNIDGTHGILMTSQFGAPTAIRSTGKMKEPKNEAGNNGVAT